MLPFQEIVSLLARVLLKPYTLPLKKPMFLVEHNEDICRQKLEHCISWPQAHCSIFYVKLEPVPHLKTRTPARNASQKGLSLVGPLQHRGGDCYINSLHLRSNTNTHIKTAIPVYNSRQPRNKLAGKKKKKSLSSCWSYVMVEPPRPTAVFSFRPTLGEVRFGRSLGR